MVVSSPISKFIGRRLRAGALLIVLLGLVDVNNAFQPFLKNGHSNIRRGRNNRITKNPSHPTTCFESTAITTPKAENPLGFYKPKAKGSWWEERIPLGGLKVGQQLSGHVVQEHLEGKTGAKLFLECGVGRINGKGESIMVFGMLRMGRSKLSVIKKRAMRLQKKDQIDLFVTRVQQDCGRFEVCLTPEDVKKYQGDAKIPASSLKPNQTVEGTVVKIEPYGVMVDVGANRLGLLHIQKVADLYGTYINKEEGLIKAGLEKGARVRLMVAENEKKRLFLDFTDATKEQSEKDRARLGTTVASRDTAVGEGDDDDDEDDDDEDDYDDDDEQNDIEASSGLKTQAQNDTGMSEEELAAWGQYSSQSETNKADTANREGDDDDEEEEEEDDEDYDDYDEQNDIEDSLGLGTY
jgi:predicted RNA-binding protein with RPS1 domain